MNVWFMMIIRVKPKHHNLYAIKYGNYRHYRIIKISLVLTGMIRFRLIPYKYNLLIVRKLAVNPAKQPLQQKTRRVMRPV